MPSPVRFPGLHTDLQVAGKTRQQTFLFVRCRPGRGMVLAHIDEPEVWPTLALSQRCRLINDPTPGRGTLSSSLPPRAAASPDSLASDGPGPAPTRHRGPSGSGSLPQSGPTAKRRSWGQPPASPLLKVGFRAAGESWATALARMGWLASPPAFLSGFVPDREGAVEAAGRLWLRFPVTHSLQLLVHGPLPDPHPWQVATAGIWCGAGVLFLLVWWWISQGAGDWPPLLRPIRRRLVFLILFAAGLPLGVYLLLAMAFLRDRRETLVNEGFDRLSTQVQRLDRLFLGWLSELYHRQTATFRAASQKPGGPAQRRDSLIACLKEPEVNRTPGLLVLTDAQGRLVHRGSLDNPHSAPVPEWLFEMVAGQVFAATDTVTTGPGADRTATLEGVMEVAGGIDTQTFLRQFTRHL